MSGMAVFRREVGQRLLPIASVLVACGSLALPCSAQIYGMTNGNATVQINAGGGGTPGMTSWTVDGVNQVKQQWFYYGIGGGPNQSIDTLGNLFVDPRANSTTLNLTYSDLPTLPNYKITDDYQLSAFANGSGISQLGEQVTFYNLTANPLTLRFFDYSDYDLNGTPNGQSLTFYTKNAGLQTYFYQTAGSSILTNSAQYGLNKPTYLYGDLFSSTLQTITNGSPSSLGSSHLTAGPGDVTGTLEWDITLAAGSSLQLSKTIYMVVPEPSVFGFLGMGLIAWAAVYRKRT